MATIYKPRVPTVPLVPPPVAPPAAPPAPKIDFSQDAYTPQANRMGMTPAAFSQQQTDYMKEDVNEASRQNPGYVVQGAQVGKYQDGTPQNYQAYTATGQENVVGTPGKSMSSDPFFRPASDSLPMRANFNSDADYLAAYSAYQAAGPNARFTSPPGGYTAAGGGLSTSVGNFSAPSGSSFDSQISALSGGRTQAQIDADLQAELKGIADQYAIDEQRAQLNGTNRKASRFSDLASLNVNPLSSSAGNVDAQNTVETQNEIQNLQMQRIAREAAARASAKNESTTNAQNMLQRLLAERDRQDRLATEQYNRSNEASKDARNYALQLSQDARAGKEFTKSERDSNRSYIQTQIATYGSRAFSNLTPQQRRDLETAAGLAAGQLDTDAQTLKEREDAAKNAPDANKFQFVAPTQYSAGGSFDPSTGTFTPNPNARLPGGTSGDGFTLSAGQSRYDSNGRLITTAPGGSNDAPDVKTINGQSTVWDPTTRTFKAVVVPQATDPASADKQKTVLDLATSLLTDPGVGGAVGPISSRLPTFSGRTADAEANIERLKSLLTLDNLGRGYLKGAISDRDLQVLSSAATSLNTNMSEAGFKKELQRIVDQIKNSTAAPANAPANGVSDSELMELRQAFPGATDAELRQMLGFNQESQTSLNGASSLGKLSSKYESGSNPGAIGYDRTGGLSYGTYQLAHNNAQAFVNSSPYAEAFKGIPFNSQAFQDMWKRVAAADPQRFQEAQHDYIGQTHFQPQVQKLAQAGIDVNSLPSTVQDVIWSTAVQHGPNNNIVLNALKSMPAGASAADLVKRIYDLRWSNGQNFASSTDAVKKSVYNRFFGSGGELATALQSLNGAMA